jgi:hypothetical protein
MRARGIERSTRPHVFLDPGRVQYVDVNTTALRVGVEHHQLNVRRIRGE